MTDILRDSSGVEVVDGGDGGAPRPNGEIAIETWFVLGFGCAKGPDEDAGSV